MKYTPGPWTFKIMDNENMISIESEIKQVNGKDCSIAGIWGLYNDLDQLVGIANAKLIAAAPDLLECLIKLQEFIRPESVYWGTSLNEKVELAIKKATE